MALETATTINQLVASNPPNSDPVAEAAAHLRLIKATLLATLPNVVGAVTATHTELSYTAGVTSPLQAQIDARASLASPSFTGVPLVPTAANGTNNNQAASTAFVVSAALSSSLPGQAGNAGKFITTNGTTASWANPGMASFNGRTGAITPQASDYSAFFAAASLSQNSKSAAYTLAIGDANGSIYHPPADTTARTWTIPANASVAYPIGTTITFDNDYGAGAITIAINTDTLVLVGAAGSTGSRTLASGGQATALKVSNTRWRINGTGLT